MRFKIFESISSVSAMMCGAAMAFTTMDFSAENLAITLGFAVLCLVTHNLRGEKPSA